MYTESILDKANGIIREMIDRDYNHPSVIMWSLANEPNAESDEAELFFKSMYETARDKDKSRPITYVAHLEPKNIRGMKYYDLICINKYYGWYLAAGQIDNTLDELGNKKVYANTFDEFNDSGELGEIETEEEWNTIEQIFESINDKKEGK